MTHDSGLGGLCGNESVQLVFFCKTFWTKFSFFVFMNCLDLMYLIDLNLKPDSITNCVVKPKGSLQKKTGYFMTICQRVWKFTKDSL